MTIDIPTLIDAAGGEIVGKVRLQKMVYLLEQLDVISGFSFEYHHYGPYSEELADAIADDIIFDRVGEEQRRRVSDGVPYVIYRVKESIRSQNGLNPLASPRLGSAIREMNRQSMTVLELAATIHWLAFKEEVPNWRGELVRRKGVKTEGGRVDSALQLLRQLELAPL